MYGNSQIYTCVSDLSSEFLIHNMQFPVENLYLNVLESWKDNMYKIDLVFPGLSS